MIRAFLVDDEPLALKRLARMLEATGRVEIVGQTIDPQDALARITAGTVDVVLLDISMPGLDGFELARRLPPTVAIVFTTAHDEHALRAFEANAIDYLLKPIHAAALGRALDKLARLRGQPDADVQLVAAMARIASIAPPRIASRLGDKVQLIELERITHFVAEDKLTYAVTGERTHVVDLSISELEDRYARAGFVRIHRATLVASPRSASCSRPRRAPGSGSRTARPSSRWPGIGCDRSRNDSASPDARRITRSRLTYLWT